MLHDVERSENHRVPTAGQPSLFPQADLLLLLVGIELRDGIEEGEDGGVAEILVLVERDVPGADAGEGAAILHAVEQGRGFIHLALGEQFVGGDGGTVEVHVDLRDILTDGQEFGGVVQIVGRHGWPAGDLSEQFYSFFTTVDTHSVEVLDRVLLVEMPNHHLPLCLRGPVRLDQLLGPTWVGRAAVGFEVDEREVLLGEPRFRHDVHEVVEHLVRTVWVPDGSDAPAFQLVHRAELRLQALDSADLEVRGIPASEEQDVDVLVGEPFEVGDQVGLLLSLRDVAGPVLHDDEEFLLLLGGLVDHRCGFDDLPVGQCSCFTHIIVC